MCIRDRFRSGVSRVARAVIPTLGGKGRPVAIDKGFGAPEMADDGFTVADNIDLADRHENMAAQLTLEGAAKTNKEVGDGTASTVTLIEAIMDLGVQEVNAGKNPMILKGELKNAVKKVTDHIEKTAIPISTKEEKAQVATVSAKDAEIGEMIADAMEKVGDTGVITVDESQGFGMELEYKEGMQFQRGYLSPYFITDPDKKTAEINDPYILVTDIGIGNAPELMTMLEGFLKTSNDIVVIAESIEEEALAVLVVNKIRGKIKSLAIKAPGARQTKRQTLEDICILTGATLITEEAGGKIEAVTVKDLGRADRVISTEEDTIIVGGKGDKKEIDNRIERLTKEVKAEKTDYAREKVAERLARLAGGVAVISVGAATESELKEKKLRVEDAVNATKAAVDKGVVAGGGLALWNASRELKEDDTGSIIIREAIKVPLVRILENAGIEGRDWWKFWEEDLLDTTLERVGGAYGVDVIKMQHADMLDEGIVDPAKAVCSELKNAESVATLLLTTSCAITDLPDEKKEN
jgi:chaperonin GroEL